MDLSIWVKNLIVMYWIQWGKKDFIFVSRDVARVPQM